MNHSVLSDDKSYNNNKELNQLEKLISHKLAYEWKNIFRQLT